MTLHLLPKRQSQSGEMKIFAQMYASTSHISCLYIPPDANFFWQGVAILFGVMFGRNAAGTGHAYNWYLTADLSGIIFFEPQNGNEMVDPRYVGNFGVF